MHSLLQIVVLDDLPSGQRLPIEQALSNGDYDVRWFSSREAAQKALEVNSSVRPALFLVDIVLGSDREGGLKFCKWLRDCPVYTDVPIILWSAKSTDSDDVATGLQMGGWDYLRKDCGLDVLLLKVDLLIELHERIEEGRRQCRNAILVLDNEAHGIVWKTEVADRIVDFFFGPILGNAAPPKLLAEIQSLVGGPRSWKDLKKAERTVAMRVNVLADLNRSKVELFEQDSKSYRDHLIRKLEEFANTQLRESLPYGATQHMIDRVPVLTRREAEVIFWAGEGMTVKEIACILEMDPLGEGVKSHLRNVVKKVDPFLEGGRTTWVRWVNEVRRANPTIES